MKANINIINFQGKTQNQIVFEIYSLGLDENYIKISEKNKNIMKSKEIIFVCRINQRF